MTRQKLKQIRHLKREIELLQEQIVHLEAEIVTDKVTGSDPDHPWTERHYIIKGLPGERNEKLLRLRDRLERRKSDLQDMRAEIFEWVEGIEDSLLRQVIILRHVNGLSWRQVAREIGAGTTWDSLRKMHDRFIEGL
jgi:DNA-directed RNA polymerase specialized sigma24 family protein